MGFARGTYAFGHCEKCGFRYPLNELRAEYDTGISRNNRVCPECWDSDHPQNFLFQVETDDPMTLKDPRPPLNEAQSRALFVSTKPVTPEARSRVGPVSVSTS